MSSRDLGVFLVSSFDDGIVVFEQIYVPSMQVNLEYLLDRDGDDCVAWRHDNGENYNITRG